jgi:hypothetical protein
LISKTDEETKRWLKDISEIIRAEISKNKGGKIIPEVNMIMEKDVVNCINIFRMTFQNSGKV